MVAVKLLTSNCGQGSVGFGAWPNWNHLPVPENSIEFICAAPMASVADCRVPVGWLHAAAAITTASDVTRTTDLLI